MGRQAARVLPQERGLLSDAHRPRARAARSLGSPIAHSLSPALHRAAYAELGLDWTYEAVQVDSAGLEALHRRARRHLAGAVADDAAQAHRRTPPRHQRRLGRGCPASPTRWSSTEPASRHGFNTDIPGAIAALQERLPAPMPRRRWCSAAAPRRRRCCWRSPSWAVRRPRCWCATRPAPRRPSRWSARTRTHRSSRSARSTGAVPRRRRPRSSRRSPREAQTPDLLALCADVPAVFEVVYDPWPTPLARAAHGRRPPPRRRARPARPPGRAARCSG